MTRRIIIVSHVAILIAFDCKSRVQVVSRQKLNCDRENIEVYRVKYDIFSIRIEFLTTNDLDSEYFII